MGFLSYIVDNDQRFRNAVKRAGMTWDDLRIPFTLILADFYRSEQAIFSLKSPGQYPDFKNGGPNSRYAKLKEKEVGFKYPLLVRKGALAASLLSPDASGSIAEIAATSLTIGTSDPKAKFHQSDEPRTKIPQRKVLFIGPEAKQFATTEQQGRPERWLNIMNDFTLKKLKQSGAFA